MKRPDRSFKKDAIELIEEAVHLLRSAPAQLLVPYFIGAIPFVLGFLYFWADMSRGAFAESHCSGAALGVALLFVWMKCWQVVFAGAVRARFTGCQPPAWTPGRVARVVMVQSALQPTALFVVPVALLITFPFAWVYAFYQNLTMQGGDDDIKTSAKRAAFLARFWQGQNHILLMIFSAFGFVVFLNMLIAFWQAPALLKTFLGIETPFTRGGVFVLLNTTLLASVCAATFLFIDPIIKTVFFLRCFYAQSIASGEDLKVELRGHARSPARLTTAVLMLCAAVCLGAGDTNVPPAKSPPSRAQAAPAVNASQLDMSIADVLGKREFAWRMPREKKVKSESSSSWIDTIIEGTAIAIRETARAISRIARKIGEWIEKLVPAPKLPEKFASGAGLTAALRWILVLLIIGVTCVIVIQCMRMWRRRRRHHDVVLATPIAAAPDLTDENVAADELPEDGWIKLAGELAQRGDLRLALRAFYLATLAHLARRELISIAKFKSNRDYDVEISRRARAFPGLRNAFSSNVGMFDSAWYGMREVTPEMFREFQANLERIRSC